MIPGANILNIALTLIASQTFDYVQFQSRSPNTIGQDVTTYLAPVAIRGSVQPVPRNLYELYGLDFQKNYVNFYVPQDVLDIGRDVSGDQMIFNGQTYQCLSDTPWKAIDGWTAVLSVQVPN